MNILHFERVDPNQIKAGDLIMCRCHDDQLEWRTARVVDIEMDAVPGVYTWKDGYATPYEYRLWLICRHINMRRLDAIGGPVYRWHRFPWNGVTRYLLEKETALTEPLEGSVPSTSIAMDERK